jgi:hypothetical protein
VLSCFFLFFPNRSVMWVSNTLYFFGMGDKVLWTLLST